MKNLRESLLGEEASVVENHLEDGTLLPVVNPEITALVGQVNKKRQPKGGKITTDTWGNPIEVGDIIIGVTDGKPGMDNIKFNSTSNLIVGRVAEGYNGGLSVIVAEPSALVNGVYPAFIDRAEALGGVPTYIRVKSGFVKVDEDMVRKIFKV